jgi:hypothetical protein
VSHKDKVLFYILWANEEELHGVRIDVVVSGLVLEVHGLDVQDQVLEVDVNQSQIGPVTQRLPLSVIISMRLKGTINHSIDIDAVETDCHIENLVLLRRPEELLVFYDSILASHSVIEDVRLTRVS